MTTQPNTSVRRAQTPVAHAPRPAKTRSTAYRSRGSCSSYQGDASTVGAPLVRVTEVGSRGGTTAPRELFFGGVAPMCDIEVDGYGTELRDEDRTARKQHRCEECHRFITPGQRYSIFAGTFERDFFQMKFCMRCTKARRWLGTRGHGWEGGQILRAKRLAAAGGAS